MTISGWWFSEGTSELSETMNGDVGDAEGCWLQLMCCALILWKLSLILEGQRLDREDDKIEENKEKWTWNEVTSESECEQKII